MSLSGTPQSIRQKMTYIMNIALKIMIRTLLIKGLDTFYPVKLKEKLRALISWM